MVEFLRRHPWLLFVVLVLVASNQSAHKDAPSPTTEQGLRVMIIEDVTQRHELPTSQIEQLTSEAEGSLIEWLKANAVEWRITDQAADMSLDSRGAQELFARPRDAVPWLVAGNGRRGVEGRLPLGKDETLAKLKGIK
jgi:hypothetical protein